MAEAEVAGVRAANRAAVEARLVEVGLRHVAERGGAALSLRAVARDCDLVPSALYRYVANRDELLTLLVVHSYTSLSDAVEARHDEVAADDLVGRWTAVASAIRDWAREHPQEFALIFGTPVPGYHAPPEQTTGPGTRVFLLLSRLGGDADARDLPVPGAGPVTPELLNAAHPAVSAVKEKAGVIISSARMMAGLLAWNLVVGAVLSELFEYFGSDSVAPDGYFDYVLSHTATSLGLAPAT